MSAKPSSDVEHDALRGFVETRGPDVISGWAWRAQRKDPVTLVFKSRGRVLGECQASDLREDLKAAGVTGGRAAFAWRLPIAGAPVDVAKVAVIDKATGAVLPDAAGVVVVPPPPVRGAVEVRGPLVISGWASGRKTPLKLVFLRGGEKLGGCFAGLPRDELLKAGVRDGRAGFVWHLPFTDPPVDPAQIEVRDEATGELIPDVRGLKSVRPGVVRGMIESRGPAVIAGWAKGPAGPVTVEFVRAGEILGRCLADTRRQGPTGMEPIGFAWPLPFCDPAFDPADVEVREAVSGIVIPDAPGLAPVVPPVVRGWVEARGPDVISGWAHGPGEPVTLHIRRGEEVLAEVVADGFRAGLRDDGVGDGRATFRWELPFGDPSYDAATMSVVEATRGIAIPDAVDLVAASRPAVCGVVEERSYRLVTGWAWGGKPGERVEIEMSCDGQVVGRCLADRLRRDLARSGVDDGRHVFHWTPPRDLEGFDIRRLVATAQPAGVVLPEKLRDLKPTGLRLEGMRVEASWLHARLRRTGEVAPPASIDFVLDGRFLLNADIRELAFDADGWADLVVELPRTVNDGRDHSLSLHDQREGDPIPGGELVFSCAFNSMVELVTPHEIRGWVIDPDDPDGEGRIDFYDGDQRLRIIRFGRARPEVAKAFGAPHAWEFVIRRLPLSLFDARPHILRLAVGERPLSAHNSPRIEVCWREDQSAFDVERFGGAVQEIDATGVKGFAIDYLRDGPVPLEVVVDGEVVAEILANRYVAALKAEAGHGFHGFSWRFPSSLMNGRRRKVAVRPAGRDYLLPPKARPVLFPLTALDASMPPAELAPPMLTPPTRRSASKAAGEPALLSLIVLNLNGAHVLEPFLASVAATEFRDPIEIIIIDHGSVDESRRIVEDYRRRLPISPIWRGVNHSFSASCNLGAALARGRRLVMVNNDIVFTGDCLAPMGDLLDADPEVGLVGLRLLEPRYVGDGRWSPVVHHTGVRFEALAPQNKAEPRMYHPVEVEEGGDRGAAVEPGVTAALAMVRKQDFRALGGFDEAYVYGYEDVDFALRLRGRLGKLAACLLGDSAVHNRSATRESKLVASAQEVAAEPPASPRAGRPPRANLDLFIRRFSRHLPRLILRQLVAGGEAWRAAPLRLSFVVADPERGADAAAARALGDHLRKRFGWEPMLIGEDGHDLAVTDVLVSLRPGFDLRRVADAAPGMITVAWDWNGKAGWDARAALYQLNWTLKPASAHAARSALANFLDGDCARIAIKAQAENEPQARALAERLRRRGRHVRIDGPRHWAGGLSACDELVVAMAGVRAYLPFAGAVNALCLTPGAEPPAPDTLAGFDLVFAPGDPDADAAALIALHERLRREFLGGLAD